MPNYRDTIAAVTAYLKQHNADLGAVRDWPSKDGTIHHFRIGTEYHLALHDELLALEPQAVVGVLHENQIAGKVRADGKGVIILVDEYGKPTSYTSEQWQTRLSVQTS